MGIKAFPVCLFILIFSQTYAQQPNIGAISGLVKDSATKKGLSLATVSVFKLTDSSIVSFKLCDDKGGFEIRNIPLNQTLKIVTTFEGYEVDRREVRLTASANYSIGTILLKPTSKSLDEVIVKSERPPIIVKKDTIEFNATAFKTLPNALVEDLFKKLPGMQVDRDGNITYNGRPVSRIYVDGKSFFNDNYKAATQILPSAIVANVQVYDDKEQLDATQKNTDYNKIINLKLKQNVKKSTFGKVSTSGGTDNRYELAGAVNFLRDTVQLTLIGYKNNLNRGIFNSSEMRAIGAFNRNWTTMTNNDNGTYTINNISFGGGTTAETESAGGGINFNHAPTKYTSFYAQYFVSHEDGYTNENINNLYINNDTINKFNIFNQLASIKTIQNLNFGFKTKSKSGNRSLTLNVGNQWSVLNSSTFNATINSNNQVGTLLNSNGKLDQSVNPKNYYHSLFFSSKLFEKNDKYRAISFQQYYNVVQNPTNFLTEIDNLSLIPTPSNTMIRQLRFFNPQKLFIINRMVLSGWKKKNTSFVLASNFDINNAKNTIVTYLQHIGNKNYDSVDANLTSDVNVSNSILKITPQFDLSIKKYMLTLSGTFFNAHQNINISNKSFNNYKDTYIYSLLYFSFYKQGGLRLSFDQQINLPLAKDLTPIVDNTNPVFVFSGNLKLQAEKTSTFKITFRKFIVKKQLNLNYELLYGNTQNPIIQSVKILSNGKQEIKSMNAGNRHSLVMRLGISKSFQKINRYNHSVNLNLSYQNMITPTVFNETEFSQKVNVFKTTVGNSFNWQDKFNLYYSYSYTANINRFTNKFTADVLSNVQNLEVEVTARLFKKVSFNTTLLANKIVYENLPALPVNLFINPSISVYFLKEDKGEIKFIVRDLLNRNNNFSRNVIGNNITETNTNVLGRYFMLTFSYNFKTFKNEQNNKVNW
ncbi:outer membrane beta-barrel protein [Sediminibacterium sp.]|uniref:outer membrane beta-barrel protein n=1 Tax=Sediminibacterium sp. TaxID=1917865 RepID=UPI0025FB2542|nr:outer membrane beta-barrel protein [Sediminibacterium sp.]MBT9485189.1 outer membrane beta-barrel protein [Sediminibacterium sp.]